MGGEVHGAVITVAEVLFWGSIGIVFYSYAVYPFIVALLVRMFGPRPADARDDFMPTVSLVISLYNEAAVLPEKLKNLEALRYPLGKLRIIFGSDGSTDATDSLLAAWSHPAREVVAFPARRGKGPVLNDLVARAESDVIVFSDANTLYEPSTISRLVRHLADPAVGAVCGELVLLPEGGDAGGSGEASYWSYETWLKRNESDFRTLLGATGGVYAIRRSLFEPLPAGKSVTDDFLIPMKIIKRGYRVVYARDALAYEKTSGSMQGEFRRKARIGAQNFAGITEFRSLLSPKAGFTAFALWSHKIIRWMVPLFAIVAVAATALLAPASLFFRVVAGCEIAFVIMAGTGFAADRSHVRLGAAGLPYYILAMNAALFVGLLRYVFGLQRTTWEVLR